MSRAQPGDETIRLAFDGVACTTLADMLALEDEDEQISDEEGARIRALEVGVGHVVLGGGAGAEIFVTRIPGPRTMSAQDLAEQQHVVDVAIVAVQLQTVAREAFDVLEAEMSIDGDAQTITYDLRKIAAVVERLGIALRQADEIGQQQPGIIATCLEETGTRS
jgi:hypothetical protein